MYFVQKIIKELLLPILFYLCLSNEFRFNYQVTSSYILVLVTINLTLYEYF